MILSENLKREFADSRSRTLTFSEMPVLRVTETAWPFYDGECGRRSSSNCCKFDDGQSAQSENLRMMVRSMQEARPVLEASDGARRKRASFRLAGGAYWMQQRRGVSHRHIFGPARRPRDITVCACQSAAHDQPSPPPLARALSRPHSPAS